MKIIKKNETGNQAMPAACWSLVFQWLEKSFSFFPMIGKIMKKVSNGWKNHEKNFQSLEKVPVPVSNGWKNQGYDEMRGLTPLFVALVVFLCAAGHGYAANGYWSEQVQYDSNTTVTAWLAADSNYRGNYATNLTFDFQRAGINAWSDNGMWWNNTYFIYKVYGQNRNPGYSSANLPRTGGSGNDHYFGWDTDINADIRADLAYRGTYTIDYYYQYTDDGGTVDTVHYYPSFTMTNGNYIVTNTSGTVYQDAFNGGESVLMGAGVHLMKQGGSTLVLTNVNTYSGYTEIQGGTIIAEDDRGFGAVPASVDSDNIRVTTADWQNLKATNTFTLDSKRGIYLSNHINLEVTDGRTLTYDGIISQSSADKAIAKNGDGLLILKGTNTFTGNLYINYGPVELGGTDPLASTYLDLGAQSGSAMSWLYLKNGTTVDSYTTVRSGSSAINIVGMREAGSATFSDQIRLNAPVTISNANSSSLRVNMMWQDGTHWIRKQGLGTFQLWTNSVSHITNEQGVVQLGTDGWFDWNHLVLWSGTTFDLDGHDALLACLEGAGDVTLGGGDLTIADGWWGTLSGDISEAGDFIKQGSGGIVLTGNNTFDGRMILGSGTVKVDSDDALPGVPSSFDADNLIITNWATLEAEYSMTINSDRGITVGPLFGGGNLWANDGITIDYDGIATGVGALMMNGGGTLKFGANADHTFTGEMGINDGTVWITRANSLDCSMLRIGPWSGTGDCILKMGDGAADNLDRNIEVRADTGAGTREITTPCTSGIVDFTGNMTLAMGLTVSGSGGASIDFSGNVDMSYSGDNDITFSGSDDVEISGTIEADTGAAALNHGGSGTLTISADNATTVANQMMINISGGGVVAISDELNLGDDPAGAYADKINFSSSGGTLQATDDVDMDSGANDWGITIASAVTADISVDDTKTLTIPGVISGAGGILEKEGTGTLILSGTSTYTGSSTINAGTMVVSGDIDLSSALTIGASGTLQGGGSVPVITINGEVDPGTGTTITTLTTEGVNIEAGGTFRVDFGDVDGGTGPGTDWDLIDAAAVTIDNNVGGGSDFIIELHDDNIANWNQLSDYSWVIISGGTFTDFDVADFTVDSTDWPAASGVFSVANTGNDLVLTYTAAAVPTYEWDAGGGDSDRDWSTAANWTADTEPTSANDAWINGSYTGEVTVAGEEANVLYIGDSDQGSLEQSDGELTLTDDLYIGGDASTEGTYELTGGSLNVGDQTFMADGSTLSKGVFKITGGIATFSDDVFVGRNGESLMVVSGISTALLSGTSTHLTIGDLSGNNKGSEVQVDDNGVLDVEGNIEIGDGSDTWGSLVVSGGVVNVDGLFNVGDYSDATGRVEIVGGVVTADTANVGSSAGSLGLFNISGGSLDVTESTDFYVGSAGTGLMNIDGTADVNIGDASGNTDFYIGNAATARGVVNQSNGTVTVSAADGASILRIAVTGGSYGEYNLAGGTLDLGNDILMANNAGSTGILTAAGGTLTAETLFLGYGGDALFSIRGAAVTLEDAQVGVIAGATGVWEISSGSLDVTETGNLQLGLRSSGIMNIDGTADVNIGDGVGDTHLQMGLVAGEPAQGTVNQTNGSVDILGSLYMGANASPVDTYNLEGGTLTLSTHIFVGQAANATGVLNAVGGTLIADELYVGYSGVGEAILDGVTATIDAGQIAVAAGSEGVLAIVDGSLDVTEAQNFMVGNAGTGTLNMDGTGELNIGDDSGDTQLILGNGAGGVGIVNQTNGTVTVDAAGTTAGSSLYLGSSGYGQYNISGGTLDILDGHMQIGSGGTGNGTLHVIGDSATISVGNDFRMNNGNSTLKVSFVSSQISMVEVADDIVIDGVLTIDDDGSLIAGTYIIVTSVNGSAVSGDFDATNWIGAVEGTVSYADDCIAITIASTAGISNSPAELVASETVGNNPAAAGYGVTNVGTGAMTYDVYTNVSWLTVSPVSGSLGTGAGQQHTVTYDVSGMSAGAYTGYITNFSGQATNNPDVVTVSLTLNAIPNPGSQSATADGNEMIRLAWTPNGTYGTVLILHKTSAISTDPTQGTAYSVGNTIDGATVIYKGTAAKLEHIVAEGSDNYYEFYSINNDHYSPGVTADDSTGVYQGGEIVEPFAYTNGTSLNGLNGGNGFSGAWSTSDSFTIVTNGDSVALPKFWTMANYPAMSANRVKLVDPGNGGGSEATRSFSSYTSGSLYIAGMMCYAYDGANKWCGFSLLSNATQKVFFGEPGGSDHELGISDYGSSADSATFDLNAWSGGGNTGNVYLLIAKYDFATRLFKVKGYYRTDTVPVTEPAGTWDVSDTMPAGFMDEINGVVIKAGCSDGGATVGDCYFDEIRVASSWDSLMGQTASYTTNYVIDTDNEVTDAAITGGAFNVAMTFCNEEGIETETPNEPNFDLWNASGIQILTNEIFNSFTYENDGKTVLGSDTSHDGYYPGGLGTYTSRWSAMTSNSVWTTDSTTLSNGTRMTFTVVDDDTVPPVAVGNRLRNPSFEIGGTTASDAYGWEWGNPDTHGAYYNRAQRWANYFHTGTNVAALLWNAGGVYDGGWWQEVTNDTPVGTIWEASGWVWREGAWTSEWAVLKIEIYDVNTNKLTENEIALPHLSSDAGDSWAQYSCVATTVANAVWMRFVAAAGGIGAANLMRIDDVSLAPVEQMQVRIGSTNYAATANANSSNVWINVTDGDLANVSAANPMRITIPAYDEGSGLSRGTTDNNTQCNMDFGTWLADNVTNYAATESCDYADTFAFGATSIWEFEDISVDDLALETNLIAVSLFDADQDRADDRLLVTNQQYGFLVVDDDDVDYPLVRSNAADQSMSLAIGSTWYTGTGEGTNVTFYIGSGALSNVTALNTMRIVINAFDGSSGLSRGTTDNSIQCNLDLGAVITDNVTNYYALGSTVDSSVSTATSTWEWLDFSDVTIGSLVGSNKVTVTLFDADNDRTDDRLSVINQQFGYIVVTNPPAVAANVIYDWFAGSGRLYNQSGGTGWDTNKWSCSDDDLHVLDAGSIPDYHYSYPTSILNKVKLDATVNGSVRFASRRFENEFSSGLLYVAWKMNFDFAGGGNSAYAGIYLMSNDTERAFIGKTPGNNVLGLRWMGATADTNSTYPIANGTGQDYIYVARYDFDTRELWATAYATNEMIAEEPNGYWKVMTVVDAAQIGSVDGIRIKGGVDSDPVNNIGNVYFDEIRAGTNWYEVTRWFGDGNVDAMMAGPSPELIFVGTNYTVGATNDLTITDAELVDITDPLGFAVNWTSPYGVFMTNSDASFNIGSRAGRVCPNWDPLTLGAATNSLGFDTNFTGFVGYNGALSVTTYVQNAFNITNSSYNDTYYITMSAENDNTDEGTIGAINLADDVPVMRALVINTSLQFTVEDDDNISPQFGIPPIDMDIHGTNVGNLLSNEGFDDGDIPWVLYSIESAKITNSAGEGGGSGVLFRQTTAGGANTNDHGGFYQDYTIQDGVSRRYLFTIRARDGEEHFDCSQIMMKMEFLDSSDSLIYYGERDLVTLLTNEWQAFAFSATSTVDSATVRVSINFDTALATLGTDGRTSMWDNARLYWATLAETNPILRLTDGQLASVSATDPWNIDINAYDAYSGLSRGTTDADTQTFVSVQHLMTNNVAQYDAGASTVDSTSPSTKNIWTWPTPIADVNDYMPMSSTTNIVVTTLRDADTDRNGDRLSVSNVTAGHFVVVDDDTNRPSRGYMDLQNLLFNPGFETNGAGWYIDPAASLNLDVTAAAAETGSYGVQITNNGVAGWGYWMGQFVDTIPGQQYTISVRAKKDGTCSIPAYYLKTENYNASGYMGSWYETNIFASLTTDWETYSRTFTVPAGTTSNKYILLFYLPGGGGSGDGTVYFDNATFTMAVGPSMALRLGTNTIVGDNDSTNAIFDVPDGDLLHIDGTDPFRLVVAAYDSESGLARTNTALTEDTNTTVWIQNLTTNDVTHYYPAESTLAASTMTSTNIWRWDTFSDSVLQTMYDAGSNAVRMTMRDSDFDRDEDQLAVTNQLLGYIRITDDDTGDPQMGTTLHSAPLVVGVDGYYANFIDDYFVGTTLNNQWRWETEPGTEGAINDGLFYYVTNAYMQGVAGSKLPYIWVDNVQYTYQMTIEEMCTNEEYQAVLFVVGDDATIQPWTYSDYQCPNVLYMCVRDYDGTAGYNWGVKLYIKEDGANETCYSGAGSSTLLAEMYSYTAADDSTFGFILNDTNVTLFATNATTYWTSNCSLTEVQRDLFTTQAYVHVGLKNDSATDIGGDYIKISNVRVVPEIFTTNTTYLLTDGDLAYVDGSNPFRLNFPAYDPTSGISRGTTDPTTQMNITVVNWITNNCANYVALQSTVDSTLSTATNIWSWTTVAGTRIQALMDGGSNRVSADLYDADNDRTDDRLSSTNLQYGYFRVIDDDVHGPFVATTGTALEVFLDGSLLTELSAGTTDVLYQVYDGALTNLAVSNIEFHVSAFDPSGLNRGTDTATTNMNLTVDGWMTNNVAQYNTSSPADTTIWGCTNIWTWDINLTVDQVEALYVDGTTNHFVSANMVDADADRDDDELWTSNQIFGFIRVLDDDTEAPVRRTHAFGGLGSKYLVVATNSHAVDDREGSSSNTMYRLTDAYLSTLDAVGDLQFSIGALDADSGISQGNTGSTNDVISFSIGAVLDGDDVIGSFDAAASSASAADIVVTNVWTFDDNSVFTPAIVNQLISAGTSVVYATYVDDDYDRTTDRSVTYSWQVGLLAVVDDDAVAPANGPTTLVVMVDGDVANVISNADSSDIVYSVTDGELADAGSAPVAFSFNVYDADSGINRGVNTPDTNMNMSVPGIATNNAANFIVPDGSSADTTETSSTSLWEFTSFSFEQIGDLYDDGMSNRMVTANIPDSDSDRALDSIWAATNQQFGYVRIVDDDTAAPVGGDTPMAISTNNGFENGAPGGDAAGWWRWWGAGGWAQVENWAARNGTNGMVWSYNTDGGYGGFGNDISVNLSNGNVFTYSIWGYCEADFTSTVKDAFLKFEFWTNNAAAWSYVVTNNIYDLLVSNRDTWVQYTIGHTNTHMDVTLVKVLCGFGGAKTGGGSVSVWWDDVTITQSKLFDVWIGDTLYGDKAVTDGALTNVSAINPFRIELFGYDTNSGLSRGTSSATTQMNLHVTALTTNNVANYAGGSADSTAVGATSVWEWTSLPVGTIQDMALAGSNAVGVTMIDADYDRLDDRSAASNQLFGYFKVIDDDIDYPVAGGSPSANMLTNPGFEIGADGGATPDGWWKFNSCGNESWANRTGTNGMAFWGSVASGNGTWGQDVVVDPADGEIYTCTAWIKAETGFVSTVSSMNMILEFYEGGASGTRVYAVTNNIYSELKAVGDSWNQYTISWTSTIPNIDMVKPAFYSSDWVGYDTAACMFDDLELSQSELLEVWIGDSNYTDNVISDGALASVDVGNPLRLVLHAYDNDGSGNSGLSRASEGATTTNMYIDVDLLTTNNIVDFVATNSSVDTTSAGATNVWAITNVISGASIQEMVDRVTNAVWATLRDADFDLPNDQLSVQTQFFGYIRVDDDDAIRPTNSAAPLQVMVDETAVSVLEGTDTNTVFEILDGELANADSAPITFSFNAWDPSGLNRGLNSADTNMNVTIDGVTTNNVTNFNASASSLDTTDSSATNLWTWVTAFDYNTIGDMYADGSSNHPVLANVVDSDNDRTGDNLWGLTNRQFGMYRVTDDDTVKPITRTLDDAVANWGTGAGSKYMVVATNGTIISDRSSDGSGVVYRVTDGYIANLTGAQYLQFVFGALDADSGISASSAGADTNEYMSMSIENAFSGNMDAFDAAESSSDAAGVVRTNVFTFDDSSVFTDPVISNLVMSAQSNAVWVTMPDSDMDRPDDQSPLYSELVGYLYVQDDDNEDALLDSFMFYDKASPTDGDVTNADFSVTGLVEDASGIWGTADATRKPLFSLYSPNGLVGAANRDMDGDAISNGDGLGTPVPISIDNIPVAYADNTLGTWTAEVTVVDYDDDGWSGDSRLATSNILFTVVDDDVGIPALTGVRIGGGTGGAGAPEVMFSEYIEVSTDNNKYLEVYNGMSTTADMNNYWVAVYNNGSTTLSWSNGLTGTLSPGGCYVIAHSLASGWSGTPNDTGVIPYNGNDAVLLMHGQQTVDVLGVVGNADVWGDEQTMVRNLDILNPSTTWVSNDWTRYPAGTYDYLGSHVGPVSDGELASAGLTVTGNVEDTYSGIYATGANQPVYSIHNPSGVAMASDETFSQAPTADGDAMSSEPLSDAISSVFTYNSIVLGVHTVSVTAVDYDHDRANDSLTTTNNVPMYVVDDDTNVPLVGVSTPVNLLRNSSFETAGSVPEYAYYWSWNEPDQQGGTWNNFMRKDWRSRSGSWEATIPGKWGVHVSDSGGWWQIVTNDYPEGTVWQASGWFYADTNWTSAVSYLSVQFYDLDTNRIYGSTNVFAHPGTNWTHISWQATSPASCVYAKWEVGTWGMSSFGALQFDDVELGPILGTPMVIQIGNSNVTAVGTGTNAVFTVTDGDLAATRGDNLLLNEDFEDSWSSWMPLNDVGLAGWAAESGALGAYLRAWPDGDSAPYSGGFWQDVASPIANETYTFTMRGLKEANFWADTLHQKLEFLDSGYAQLLVYTNSISLDNVSAAWQTYSVSGAAPGAGAAYVRATILFGGGTNDGGSSSYYIDNVSMWAGDSMNKPLQIRFGAYDEQSGLARGTDDPSTQMNVTVAGWITDNVADFSLNDSQAGTTNIGAVSTWEWDTLDRATISALYNAGSNAVNVDLYDADYDRVADYLSSTDELFGYLRVIDDDTNGPVAQQLEINWSPANETNYVTDGSLHVGSYGVKITYEDPSGIFTNYLEGWMPDFDLIAPNGVTGISSATFENFNSLTNGTVLEAWKNWGGSVDYTNVATGVWSVVWSAQDDDKDRYDDRSYTSKSGDFTLWTNVFTVYDDDDTAPIAPSNLVASVTYWTNINDFAFTWDPAIDDSGIAADGYRIYTNSMPNIDDGTPMAGSSVTNTITNDVYNGGFEIGDGASEELVYSDTYGWWNRGSEGSRGRYSKAQAQAGTNSMMTICDAGTRPNGSPRYSLIQNYVPIDNTNDYPGQVTLSAAFLGDLSSGANADFCCAFLKMEYCDANSNVIAPPVANEYDDGLNGRPGYGIDTSGTWSNMTVLGTNMPANTEYILASVGIGNNGTKLACSGYWDNVSVQVDVITPSGTFGASYTNAAEGSNTVWLYVVDDDNDRPGDQLMSGVTNFTIMYDATAPDQIINVEEYDGPDETCEVELRWDACTDAGGVNLSPWRGYRIYYTDEARDPTTNDSYFSADTTGNTSLDSMTTDSVILSNFIFGLEYSFAIVGEDVAGNISAISTSITHYFAGFFMTQGISTATSGKIGWTAHDDEGVVDRPYDVLYQDALHFTEVTTNHWTEMATVTNSYLIDSTITAIPNGYTRFYRAAQDDRWQTNRNPRIASAEIYGMRKLTLYPGQNWVQFPFTPDTASVAYVIGTNLPGGTGVGDMNATHISWYEKTLTQTATNEIYMGNNGVWYYANIGGTGIADDKQIPLNEGILIEIPTNQPSQDIWLIGKVPTNETNRDITIPPDAYSFVGYNQTRYAHPSQLGLVDAGFRSSSLPFPWPGSMDLIMVWNNETQTGRNIWRDSSGSWRYANPSPSFPLVPTNALNPNNAFIIDTEGAAQSIPWETDLIYPVPTREMSP